MHSFSIITSALAFAASALAGQATINNKCSYDVYLWTAEGFSTSDMTTIPAGQSYSTDYLTSGGVSMKLSKGTDIWSGESIAQLEYTADADALWYDLSLINGDPFESDRTVITPQADQSDSCTAITCPAGLTSCADAYMHSSDNWATHSCPAGTNIVTELCSSADTKRAPAPVRAHARAFNL